MSKCHDSLHNFICSLPSSYFPKDAVLSYLARTPPSAAQCGNMYDQASNHFRSDPQSYNRLAMLLYIGLQMGFTDMIEKALQFFEVMIRSRMVMVVFKGNSQFQLSTVLMFLDQTLEKVVLKCLNEGHEQQLVDLLKAVNNKKYRFNEICFLLEMMLIKKIQHHLQSESLQQFNILLKSLLSSQKWEYLDNKQTSLKFKRLVLLRQEDDRQDIYSIQFLPNNKLIKCKESRLEDYLAPWIIQAYRRQPHPIDMADFTSRSVSKVFQFFTSVEVFASSPQIQELDSLIEGNQFMTFFQSFLLGYEMGNSEYCFSWQRIGQSLEQIRARSKDQSQCYKQILVQQISNILSRSSNHL